MIGDRRLVGGTRRPGGRGAGAGGDIGAGAHIGGGRDIGRGGPGDGADGGGGGGGAGGGTGALQRAALGMAAGTGISRLTGLVRIIVLAYVLGATHLADAYNLANTTPNMLYDVVLGGVLAATFIPVFVDRLATRDEWEAWRAISSIVTIAVVLLVAMTVIFWLLAPQVIDAYTALDRATGAAAIQRLAAEKAVATTLLRWFVPQVALYGLISLLTALLNTRRRFAAPMWVPVANNVVVIGVLLWFHAMVPKFPSLATAGAHRSQLVLLGLGTTLGVVLQALMLIPSLRGVGLGKLRWRWDPRHEAVQTVIRLGGWTFGFVLANQVALYIVLALAVAAAGSDPVSSYTYAYTFMQMPYAVVAVSIMSAVTPDLSERWATGDAAGFRKRLTVGLRATLAVILPAAVGLIVLAKPAVALLLGHGSTSVHNADSTGSALAMFSLGLPGFCAYLYIVRVLQAMQRTRVAFWLYVVENGLNIVLAVALVHPLGVRGLALSLSVAYTVAAAVGVVVLRRWLGPLGTPGAWAPMRRVAGASVAMGVAVLLVSNVSGASQGLGLLLRVGAAVVAGIIVYGGLATLLSGRTGPMGLISGGSLDSTVIAGDRREVGAGAGLGAAWGDTRVPVNPGPRIRIVPSPGSAPPPMPDASPVSRARAPRSPRPGPAAAPGRSPAAPLRPPVAPGRSGPPTVMWPATRAPDPHRPGPDDAGDVRAGEGAGDADEPGERRWIGGNGPRRARPPR